MQTIDKANKTEYLYSNKYLLSFLSFVVMNLKFVARQRASSSGNLPLFTFHIYVKSKESELASTVDLA